MSGAKKIIAGLSEAVSYARGNAAGAVVRQVKVPQSVDAFASRLFTMLKLADRDALVQGDPLDGRVLLDGQFDLRSVARDMLRKRDW